MSKSDFATAHTKTTARTLNLRAPKSWHPLQTRLGQLRKAARDKRLSAQFALGSSRLFDGRSKARTGPRLFPMDADLSLYTDEVGDDEDGDSAQSLSDYLSSSTVFSTVFDSSLHDSLCESARGGSPMVSDFSEATTPADGGGSDFGSEVLDADDVGGPLSQDLIDSLMWVE